MTTTEARVKTLILRSILLFTFTPILSLASRPSQPVKSVMLDLVLGLDSGELLVIIGVLGWLMFLTIPIGLLSLLAYGLYTRPRDKE